VWRRVFLGTGIDARVDGDRKRMRAAADSAPAVERAAREVRKANVADVLREFVLPLTYQSGRAHLHNAIQGFF
jgi:hypothetical protein